jgi:hypothetical protein
MSGSYPTTPVPKSITITGISPALVSVTHSLRRQVRSRGGQRWKIEADYAPLTRAAFAPLFAFANAQRGQYETFTYVRLCMAQQAAQLREPCLLTMLQAMLQEI